MTVYFVKDTLERPGAPPYPGKTMILFLLTFFLTYGAIHLYVFLKVKGALHPGPGIAAALAFFMAFMVLAPVLVRILDRHALMLPARSLAFIGYTWMGFLFFFFWLALLVDLYNLGLRLLALWPGLPAGRFLATGKTALVFVLVLTMALGLWSMLAAWRLRPDHLPLKTGKLPARMDSLRIVHISDLHLGLLVGPRRLERILRVVKEARPHLLICTGDLVDAQTDTLDHLAKILAAVQPPLGKLAVTGNHEFYAGIEQSERFLKAAGFSLLRGEAWSVEGILNVVGLDDPAHSYREKNPQPGSRTESALLKSSNRNLYTLLLKHRPVVEPDSLGRFDLQLSGHTHKGQIFPFSLITGIFYPRQNGLYRLNKGSLLYCSRGAGTWGPPMRFLSPPHVTVIELEGDQDARPRAQGRKRF